MVMVSLNTSREVVPSAKGTVWVPKAQSTSSNSPVKGATSSIGGGRNRLCALSTFQYLEASPDVVMGMLQILSYNIYILLDPKCTLSCVTPYEVVSFGFDLKNIF